MQSDQPVRLILFHLPFTIYQCSQIGDLNSYSVTYFLPFICTSVSFEALLDNYIADENSPEKPSAAKLQEEDAFINAVAASGGPMEIVFQYLRDKGKISLKVITVRGFPLLLTASSRNNPLLPHFPISPSRTVFSTTELFKFRPRGEGEGSRFCPRRL